MSHNTITLRRSNRSTITPPTVPRRNPGSTRVTITRLTAAPELSETRAAIARIAMSPIQSPRLEITWASHNRKNDCVPNTRHGAGGIGGLSASGGMNGAPGLAGCSSAILGSSCAVGGVLDQPTWPSSDAFSTVPVAVVRLAVAFFAVVFLAVAFLAGPSWPWPSSWSSCAFLAVALRRLLDRSLRCPLVRRRACCSLAQQLDRLRQRDRHGIDAARHRRVEGAVGDVGAVAAVEHAHRRAALRVRTELGEGRLRRRGHDVASAGRRSPPLLRG